STAVMDNFASHSTVEKAVSKSERQTVRGSNAPKVLPWVHIAISNAKSLFTDMYHGIKEEFLQEYLNEFCYKFNRKYFGDRMFDRLVIAAVSYKPTFEHKLYNGRANCG
ncbi:transposase, partial [Bacteroides sp. Ga6A1]